MPVEKRLEEVIDEVLDNLKAELEESELLSEIKMVVIGDRMRSKPDLPMIWVLLDPITPSHTHRAIAETWTLPIMLISFAQSHEPEIGFRKANELASLARSVVLKDKTLGGLNYIQDIQSGVFNPARRDSEDESIFGAGAVVNIILTILET